MWQFLYTCSLNENEIEIWLSKDDFLVKNGFSICFSNNGKPLPENFSFETFINRGITAGENAGNGFGGWYINEIVKYLNGGIEIIDETKPYIGGAEYMIEGLSTTFEIHLPIMDTITYE